MSKYIQRINQLPEDQFNNFLSIVFTGIGCVLIVMVLMIARSYGIDLN